MKHPIKKGACYVIHQGIVHIPDLFDGQLVKFVFYPEYRMTALKRRIGVRFEDSIVTESAQLISCYDKRNVWIWDNGWVNPEDQTYGRSFEFIESDLLGFDSSIPYSISQQMDSRNDPEKLKEKIRKQYECQ